MEKTKWHSWKSGNPAKGCRMCVKGRKLVLFVTGLCSRQCWYCPLSKEKKNKDFVYANEWKIEKDSDIIKEAELCSAEGAGITGGDPFLRLERTIRLVKLLKKKFGKGFHIHIYAPFENLTEKKLLKLYNSGVDEIRLHPDTKNMKKWDLIRTVSGLGWDVGIEIPAVPGTGNETEKMIGYFIQYISFLNLNELEQSDTNMEEMLKRKMLSSGIESCAVKGSKELALRLAEKFSKKGVGIHFCTSALKDRVQLAKRIMLRAQNSKKPYDKVTKEGLLVRGALYTDDLKPGLGYRKKLDSMTKQQKEKSISELKKAKRMISKKYCLKKGMIEIDTKKPRILVSEKDAKRIKIPRFSNAVVTEYPTWDSTEIEIEFLE